MVKFKIGKIVDRPIPPTNLYRIVITRDSFDGVIELDSDVAVRDFVDEDEALEYVVLATAIKRIQQAGYGRSVKDVNHHLVINTGYAADQDLITNICGTSEWYSRNLMCVELVEAYWFDAVGDQYLLTVEM